MDQQMSQILRMMQAMQQDGAPYAEGAEQGMPPLMLLQTFLPYLPPQQQKSIGGLLQIIELQQSLTEYANKAIHQHSPHGADWRYEMLTSIRPHLPYRKQRTIDALVKIIELNDIFDELGEPHYGI